MNCNEIQELLVTDYFDGQMAKDLEDAVKKHIDTCRLCRKRLDELENLRTMFKKASRFTPPPEVWWRIREAIITQRAKERRNAFSYAGMTFRQFFSAKPMAVALTLLVIIFTFILVYKPAGERQLSSNGHNGHVGELALWLYEDNTDETYSFGTEIEEYFL